MTTLAEGMRAGAGTFADATAPYVYNRDEIIKYRNIFAKDEVVYIAAVIPATAYTVTMLLTKMSEFVESTFRGNPYGLIKCGILFALLGVLFGTWYQEACDYQYVLENSECKNDVFLHLPSAKFVLLEHAMRFCSFVYHWTLMPGICLWIFHFWDKMQCIPQTWSLWLKILMSIFTIVTVVYATRKNNLVKVMGREIDKSRKKLGIN